MTNIRSIGAPKRDRTSKPTRKRQLPAGVTFFRPDSFSFHVGQGKPAFGLHPDFVEKVTGPSAAAPQQGSREEMILQLGLTDETILALDAIAATNDLTFGEAITFHLAMTL